MALSPCLQRCHILNLFGDILDNTIQLAYESCKISTDLLALLTFDGIAMSLSHCHPRCHIVNLWGDTKPLASDSCKISKGFLALLTFDGIAQFTDGDEMQVLIEFFLMLRYQTSLQQ